MAWIKKRFISRPTRAGRVGVAFDVVGERGEGRHDTDAWARMRPLFNVYNNILLYQLMVLSSAQGHS